MTDDQPRHAAASPDNEYSLPIEDVGVLYEAAGLPRDRRTIQRYCAQGKLDCHRIEIAYGEKYFVTPASVATHIAYIKEVRRATAGRDEPRPVAPLRDEETRVEQEPRQVVTSRDEPRPAATEDDGAARYVARLENENEFLRGQIAVKDNQIGALLERDRETNFLIRGLQTMLAPLLGHGASPDKVGDNSGSQP
jgi:hypothetical protein